MRSTLSLAARGRAAQRHETQPAGCRSRNGALARPVPSAGWHPARACRRRRPWQHRTQRGECALCGWRPRSSAPATASSSSSPRLRLPAGAELTGQFTLQPAVKALAAVLLAVAVQSHPIRRERRWLVPALGFSAAGDFLLAMPWWEPSFVLGLGAFLVAHLCFLAALLPLVARTPARMAAATVLVCVCVALLVWFWPRLVADGMAVPVTLYMAVLGAMVCAALLARLPTTWTALGAVCFAVLGRHDRHRQVRAAVGGARRTDLVGVRDVAAVDHRRIPLRPGQHGVGRLCYTGCVTTTRQAAEHEPIARVLPMLSVPHLDRDFDYLVSADQSDDAQPGVRVRVRFHGRLVDAFVLERRSGDRPCR